MLRMPILRLSTSESYIFIQLRYRFKKLYLHKKLVKDKVKNLSLKKTDCENVMSVKQLIRFDKFWSIPPFSLLSDNS